MTGNKPTRRDLFKLMTAATALAMPASARAELGPPGAANPAHFRFSLGDVRLTVVSDGYLGLPSTGLAINAERADVEAFLRQHFLASDMVYAHTNHLFIETGAHKVLVDVGSGHRFLKTAGRLLSNLETAGIAPEDITHVVITHAHPDHIWGIRDDFDEAVYPNAQYIIGEAEYNYWMKDGLAEEVPDEAKQFVVGAVNSINTEGIDWTLAGDGFEVVPGVTLLATPGHTPGHMSVRIDSGAGTLIALGDSMSHAYTNFEHPDWYNSFDMNPEETVATRQKLLSLAAADRIAVIGYHFPFPGVGHVRQIEDNYQFIPALWQFD